MKFFGKGPEPDAILDDLPRGQEGRRKYESLLPHTFFEQPETLVQIGFEDGTADNFLGVVQANTRKISRDDGRIEYETTGGVAVGNRDDRHRTLVAGSRSGKGRSCIIPTLLTYGGAIITIDPKGENASITARYRSETLKQTVITLDPFETTKDHCQKFRKQFNPLSILLPASPTLVEDAGLIADALVVPSGTQNTYWDETAKAFLTGLILHVVTHFHYSLKQRTLVTVADLLFGKMMSFNELLQEMLENTSLDNFVMGTARTMQEKADKERASVLSTARKNLQFIQFDAIRSVLSGHDFDLEDLKSGNLSVYLCLPAMRMGSCAQWLRLMISMTLGAMERSTLRPKMPVLMILDEMPVLGRLECLETAIGQIAGFGLRIWTILQDLGQLKALYGDRWETFLGNSGVLQFFGTVDHFSSKWVSDYLDKTTLTITDIGSLTADQKHSQGATGMNEKQQVQELMSASEIRRYFARDDHFNRQLVLIPGKRPYILQRVNYDQHALFSGRFDKWR